MNIEKWQALTMKEKNALFERQATNQPNNYAYRAYNFIPQNIRADIEYVIRRETASNSST